MCGFGYALGGVGGIRLDRVVRRGITFAPKRGTRVVVTERRARPVAPRAGDRLAVGV